MMVSTVLGEPVRARAPRAVSLVVSLGSPAVAMDLPEVGRSAGEEMPGGASGAPGNQKKAMESPLPTSNCSPSTAQ